MTLFVVDIEADGPYPGDYSMVSFGIVKVQTDLKNTPTFYGKVAPVISYSDRNWGEGNMYLQLGFMKDKVIGPGYWYTKDYVHKTHRFGFTKHSLIAKGYDPKLTEFQIMDSLGYGRIYDCGSVKYVWVNTV
jgi:hypothetical protein